MFVCFIPVNVTLDISGSPIGIQWGSRKISRVTGMVSNKTAQLFIRQCQMEATQWPISLLWSACSRCKPIELPWIFPGAPLKINGAPGNIQGNSTGMPVACDNVKLVPIRFWRINQGGIVSMLVIALDDKRCLRFKCHEFETTPQPKKQFAHNWHFTYC